MRTTIRRAALDRIVASTAAGVALVAVSLCLLWAVQGAAGDASRLYQSASPITERLN